MRAIVYANPDGTAAVVTPVARDGETEMATLVRIARELGIPDDAWDAVRPELVAALRRADQPAPGSLIPADSFRERIAMAYLRLATAAPEVQAKWDRIMGAFLPPGRPPVNLLSPTTAAIVAAAVADGLLSDAEAAAATAH